MTEIYKQFIVMPVLTGISGTPCLEQSSSSLACNLLLPIKAVHSHGCPCQSEQIDALISRVLRKSRMKPSKQPRVGQACSTHRKTVGGGHCQQTKYNSFQ